MKVTMENLFETFNAGYEAEARGDQYQGITFETCVKSGLRAVIEKHIGPMIEDAFRAGGQVGFEKEYAARIISSLTEPEEKERT